MGIDFVTILEKREKGERVAYPEFTISHTDDLMIRGNAFYAIWDEKSGYWSTNEESVVNIVDNMLYEYKESHEEVTRLQTLRAFSSNKWSEWQKYCRSRSDSYHDLDTKIVFSNDAADKTKYATFALDYPIAYQDTPAYDELMDTIYGPSEREKLEWAVGSIIAGDSKFIQKFIVLYGGPGTGKSTFLNIIQDMFPGYCSTFESKGLRENGAFGLESLAKNPLIAIEHDGDLSRIEDNTKLNSVVSHETMVINEKYKSKYEVRFHSFLFMGTNKPVQITDAKSGLLRRLIDVRPTGNRVSVKRYDQLMAQIRFEYSGIAAHCLKVYSERGRGYYDDYIAESMILQTNYFYNFVEDNLDLFLHEPEEGITLGTAWKRYKEYAEDTNIKYKMNRYTFRDELKVYFDEFYDRRAGLRSVYRGFKKDMFVSKMPAKEICDIFGEESIAPWLQFSTQSSEFDDFFATCPAQYATQEGVPERSWDLCTTTLIDLDTSREHYIRPPENLVCIDFDVKNPNGEKDYELNAKSASVWPQTYAELSKSGGGIHLYYYYTGDVTKLSRLFGKDIEIKIFTGKSALRRKLTKCNNIPIATIHSGLPLKEVKPVLPDATIKSERSLRMLIKRNLNKEIHSYTKPSIDFIYKNLNDAYESGLKYDVTDLRPEIQNFAMSSTNNADYCLRMVSKMKFQSEEQEEDTASPSYLEQPIVIFDVEVFPNLFVVCWKELGDEKSVVKMINPKAEEVEQLTKFRLIGFNNRKYDNHIMYARMMGYSNEALYNLSQSIIAGDKDALFGAAYNLSYTDIYDFLSSGNKMGLKKWEIKLGIHHQESALRWDEPVPEDRWMEVADYCANDVIATEALWNSEACKADWLAREILADLAGLTVNDTTNQCTTKLIVGDDRNPQSQFVYTDLSTIFPGYEYDAYGIDPKRYNPGAKIVRGKSIYRGEDPGEGGYALGNPGIYYNVALLDVASMHPHSAIRLGIFGEKYTKTFENLVEARVFIKHGEYDKVRGMFDGKIDKWLDDPTIKPKQLANALKTAINSVYGLTAASFSNKLKDPNNKDNIVAKYGALFMINLKHEVENRGYTVVHIKTDSIKIANATPEIIQFVMDYGKEYGYTFEHEATYERICILNDAVYVAKYNKPEIDDEGNEHWWTATGKQFQVPYLFKTLFSHEPITFSDLCETKSCTTALYLDFNEGLGEDEHNYSFVGRVGLFCPVVPGVGGGVLLREDKDRTKYDAVNGTKKPGTKDEVYRWLEAEVVQMLGVEDKIDYSYFNHLVDEAIEAISQYGDFEQFVSDVNWIDVPEGSDEELPFPLNNDMAA